MYKTSILTVQNLQEVKSWIKLIEIAANFTFQF